MAVKMIDRIFEYLEFKGIPHTRFEKELGLSNGYLMAQKKRNSDLGEGVVKKFIDYCLDVNLKWFVNGEGSMLIDSIGEKSNLKSNLSSNLNDKTIAKTVANPNNTVNEPPGVYGDQLPSKLRMLTIAVDKHNDEHIIFVPVTAHAGYLRSITDPEWVESLPTLTITGMLPPGTYRAFEVRGDSMEGTFEVGDRAIARYVDSKDRIYDNNNYVIVTNDGGIVIKRIRQEKGHIRCFSDNDAYGPYTIKNAEILEMWHVEAILRFTIKAKQPNQLVRLAELENEVKTLRSKLDGK